MALAPVYNADLTYLYRLAGLWPEGASVPEPEPVPSFDTLEGVEAAIRRAPNLDDAQKRGLIAKLRPIAQALIEQAERERPRRSKTRRAG